MRLQKLARPVPQQYGAQLHHLDAHRVKGDGRGGGGGSRGGSANNCPAPRCLVDGGTRSRCDGDSVFGDQGRGGSPGGGELARAGSLCGAWWPHVVLEQVVHDRVDEIGVQNFQLSRGRGELLPRPYGPSAKLYRLHILISIWITDVGGLNTQGFISRFALPAPSPYIYQPHLPLLQAGANKRCDQAGKQQLKV